MSKETLKLALEALHGFIPYLPLNDEAQCGRYDEALTAIKEALAQPNFCPICGKRLGTNDWDIHTCTPPQRTWVGLTDEDWIKALELCDFDKEAAFEFFEAKLKEKNS